MEIEYSDGLEIEERIERLLNDAEDLSSLSNNSHTLYGEWPVRYHLSAERANLLRHLNFTGLDVLELGAGMGAVSRFLAERSKTLTVVEGTEQRFKALSERLRDLDNWTGVVANIADVKLEKKFDVVCVIGVLEYSELYVTPTLPGQTPFEAFLAKAKSFLTDNGVLVLAIENQMGLKYWNGIPEDHTNQLFDSISGYPLKASPKTFSRKALKSLLERSGFPKCTEYFPFPDYKVPSSVVSSYGVAAFPELSADLACHRMAESYSGNKFPLYPEVLASHTVAKAGLLAEFSNSFLFVAAQNEQSAVIDKVCPKDGAIAWHYSVNRKFPTQTVFRQQASGKVVVEKTALLGKPSRLNSDSVCLEWAGSMNETLENGDRLRLRLLQRAHFEGVEKLVQELKQFIQWSFEKWKIENQNNTIAGEALDAVYSNALLSPSDGIVPFTYKLFDLEWRLVGQVTKEWFIFRNVLMLQKDFSILRPTPTLNTLESIYHSLCQSLGLPGDLESCISLEAELQTLVTPESTAEAFEGALRLCVQRPFERQTFLRDPKAEEQLRSQAMTLKQKAPALLNAFDRRLPRLFFKIEAKLRESTTLRSYSNRAFQLVRNLYRFLPAVYHPANFQVGDGKKSTGPIQRRFGALPKMGWVLVKASLETGAGTQSDITLCLHSKGKPQKVFLKKMWLGSFQRILKLSHDTDALSFEIPTQAQQDRVASVMTRKLSKVEAALRLISPQLPSILSNKEKRKSVFSRGISLWKQGGYRGLIALTQQLALLGDVGFVEDYSTWIEENEALTEREIAEVKSHVREMPHFPLISVILPVYNPDPQWLKLSIDSVLHQYYPNWELCIADDASTNPVIREILEEYRAKDPRINVVYRLKNGHISEASNSALSIASGQYVALLDHDDELSPLALYFVADALNRNRALKFLYSDEDKIDHRGRRYLPHFKTDWNEELFYSYNLFTHLSVMDTALVKKLGGFRVGFEGSQDYDLFLRFIELINPSEICHIPRVLYHWRAIDTSTSLGATAKPYAFQASERALRDHFTRTGVQAEVKKGINDTHKILYALPEVLPKISVIICTRDRVDLLKNVVDDLTNRTNYRDLEIIVVDNESKEPATLSFLKDFSNLPNRKVIRHDESFNFSAMNNLGVSAASGSFVLLLNNDIRTIHPEWLEEMLRLALRPLTGAVGAKLFYPSDRIQHAGVILGIGGVAGHSHKGFGKHSVDFYARTRVAQWISGVTGACLLVKKDLYEKVGGLDEKNLTVAFNDVDFCLKLREAGYHNIFTPHAQLYHLESESRGSDQREDTQPRFKREEAFMKKKWGDFLKSDPFYNPNLTLTSENFALSFPPRIVHPWRMHQKTKRRSVKQSPSLPQPPELR